MPETFLTALAKPQPDPGGGAAAAYGALLGLALLEKIISLEGTRVNATAPVSRSWKNKQATIKSLFSRMENLLEQDRKIYPKLVQIRRSKAEGQILTQVIEESITVPLEIMEAARQGLALISWVGVRCKKVLVADVLVAWELLGAALHGAFQIGSSNLPLVKEIRKKKALYQKLIQALRKGEEAWSRIKNDLGVGQGLEIR